MRTRCFFMLSLLFVLFAVVRCGQQVVEEPAPAQAVQPPASPVVHPDGRVTFSILAPESKNVMLTVTNVPDTMQMNRDENGIWSLTIGPLEPEIWEYSFLVDTVTCIDTDNAWIKDEPRPMMSMVEVPADPPAFYEAQEVPHGLVTTHLFKSPVLDVWRTFKVYTPPGYDRTNSATYPVLYLLHGGAGDDKGWTTNGRAHLILDNLIDEGGVLPMIIVMPDGQYRGDGVPADGFEQDLLNVIIPTIEREYRVKADAQNRAMAGLSMGGGQTLDIGVTHPEMFTWIGIFSSGNIGENIVATHGLFLDQANNNLNLFWLGVGDRDRRLTPYKEFVALLDQKGTEYSFMVYPGAHEWDVWRKCLRDFAQLLFRTDS
ncbi:esterase [Candidatus Latescibacterota bacterium]